MIMGYKRKTKDVYRLIWNGEEIDSFDTLKEAKEMRIEYELAFHDSVSIKLGRERIGA
jgi:hypothetical protein